MIDFENDPLNTTPYLSNIFVVHCWPPSKMVQKVVIVFISLCLLQAQAASFRSRPRNLLHGRIVGGKSADRGQFPHHVALANTLDYFYFCGGTIISTRHILTEAHCVQWYQYDTTDLRAILNTSNLKDDDFTAMEIAEVYNHPRFIEDNVPFDIAILYTRREIEFNDFIQPAQLPTMDYTQHSGDDAVIAGWGLLSV